ncbi:LOW QUALITY PROTEIN: major allergen I polypeptide chain 1-like [Budorcas taxicolor]|uniref:LOW QUALITY PROTEIN: major allergen I polypeptide chain 1-like n=1 Tax=Budorcas taxicolor TaxID=37181 RepID=UPI0022839C70|nr:LOW QUALITY PROTEIN: major allergen I polypeptide chain 1-like [Budorcas taxicolor]
MTRAGALLLLCAALLLITGGNCDNCPAVREDVYLFVGGTPEEYIAKVKEYNTNSAIVANTRRLKDRVDEKLTEEDKQNALSILNKIYSSSLC